MRRFARATIVDPASGGQVKSVVAKRELARAVRQIEVSGFQGPPDAHPNAQALYGQPSMTTAPTLPVPVLELVLSQAVLGNADLARCALVSSTFLDLARRSLYWRLSLRLHAAESSLALTSASEGQLSRVEADPKTAGFVREVVLEGPGLQNDEEGLTQRTYERFSFALSQFARPTSGGLLARQDTLDTSRNIIFDSRKANSLAALSIVFGGLAYFELSARFLARLKACEPLRFLSLSGSLAGDDRLTDFRQTLLPDNAPPSLQELHLESGFRSTEAINLVLIGARNGLHKLAWRSPVADEQGQAGSDAEESFEVKAVRRACEAVGVVFIPLA
ncbi:hypothetical protein JCM8547_005283 [Rhodosporidiobolus lusitaniae]